MKTHSLKLILRADKIDSIGEAPLYLRIIRNRETIYLAVATNIKPEFWNEKEQIIKKNHPNSARLNNYLKQYIAKVNNLVLDLSTTMGNFRLRLVKEKLTQKVNSASVFERFDNHILELEQQGKIRSLSKARVIYSKFKKYVNNRDMSITEIDVTFLKEYETYLRYTVNNSVNSVHTELKKFRKLINDAIREDVMPESANPFKKFKLKTENKEMEYLTEEELKLLEDLDLTEGSAKFNHRNLFVFCAYAGGLRISDALNLRWKNFDGKRINFTITKVNEQHSVKLPDKAKNIIKLYSEREKLGENSFIFPILKEVVSTASKKELYRDISSKTAYINKILADLGKKCGITKRLNFHCSRHTFATLALSKGMRIEYVSKLMGHSNIKMTQRYAKFINADLENAMDIMN